MLIKGSFVIEVIKVKEQFGDYLKRLSPTLRRIAHKLNGHFSFFDDDDLVQEALAHLWVSFQAGKMDDKTDSYILQGCYFHLKNYLRKTLDKAKLASLNQLIDDGDSTFEELLASEDTAAADNADCASLVEAARREGLTDREVEILTYSLEGLTVREIGKRLGISHVRVVKLKERIKAKASALKNICRGRYQN